MDSKQFAHSTAGKVIRTDGNYWAYVPHPLPPALRYDARIVNLLTEATLYVGKLSGIGAHLPNPDLLITPYVKREAVLSSKIEGTQASLSDLFYFEAANHDEKEREKKTSDVLEVVNYVKAMHYGLKRLKELPLCLRLIREIHRELMSGVRGDHLTPGEFRTSQNWIGVPGCTLDGASFVPPPVHDMKDALAALEKFWHQRDAFPGLIQCALIHYQFETIHPFLDGNGRIGRLLNTLFLCERGYLAQPLLYLSAFFEKHRDAYYHHLLNVSKRGAWEEWIAFFLQGVVSQSQDAIRNSNDILSLRETYHKGIHRKRPSAYVLKLIDVLFQNPYITIPLAARTLSTTYPTAKAAVDKLQDAGILFEVSDKRRNKVYCARQLLEILEEKQGK